MTRYRIILSAVLVACTFSARAAVVHDETTDGDLSGDPEAPTALAFDAGGNIVTGSMGAPDDVRDFITFTVPSTHSLTGLLLLAYEDAATGGPGNRGFHAINLGATSFIPGPETGDFFLGGAHLDPEPSGTDLLPILAAAPEAGIGFSVPLDPDTYSYIIQQTGTDLTDYSIEFIVEQRPIVEIPTVNSLGLVLFVALLTIAAATMLRRRPRSPTSDFHN